MDKKIKIALGIILVILALIVGSFWKINSKEKITRTENKILSKTGGEEYFFTGSLYKGNFVYGGAMQLAFNELKSGLLHDNLKLSLGPNDKEPKRLLDIFNNSIFSKNDLDESSYYIKSGYGQNTVDTINRESRTKFSQKTFADLSLTLNPKDIISYAYFLKQVEYPDQFKIEKIDFMGEMVNGFTADSNKQKKNIYLIDYVNDKNFIVRINLKDNSDELILAKGYPMDNPKQALLTVVQKNSSAMPIDSNDMFSAPNVNLEYNREYKELINKTLYNQGFEQYKIGAMFENIKFNMDNKGARVENEGVIVSTWGESEEVKGARKLIFDKPYWIIMKRANSANPYFILGINNSALLEK
jgi:hypothetical protein